MIETKSPEPVAPFVRHLPWAAWLVAALVVVLGVGAGIAVARRGDDRPAASTSAGIASQLASVDQACTGWMMGGVTASTVPATWCADMTAWMGQQVTSGSMMGQMMWGDPDRMLTACRTWTASNPSWSSTWCDDMVAWMGQHLNGDWDGSMMNGWMMGG